MQKANNKENQSINTSNTETEDFSANRLKVRSRLSVETLEALNEFYRYITDSNLHELNKSDILSRIANIARKEIV